MAQIKINDIPLDQVSAFQNTENLLEELTEMEIQTIRGGALYGFNEFLNFGVQVLHYSLLGFAIYNIALLATQFSANSLGSPLGMGLGGNPEGEGDPVLPNLMGSSFGE